MSETDANAPTGADGRTYEQKMLTMLEAEWHRLRTMAYRKRSALYAARALIIDRIGGADPDAARVLAEIDAVAGEPIDEKVKVAPSRDWSR